MRILRDTTHIFLNTKSYLNVYVYITRNREIYRVLYFYTYI